MRRSDDTSPFDHELDARDDLTQEFWGPERRSHRRSSESSRPTRRVGRIDDTGSIRALREGVAAFRPQRVELRDATGQVRRTRAHGAPGPVAPSLSDRRAAASIGDLAAGHFDDDLDLDRHDDLPLTPVAPVPSRLGPGAVDPLLARLGALVLVGVLLVPLALALRPASAEQADSFQLDAPSGQAGTAAGADGVAAAGDVILVAETVDGEGQTSATAGTPETSVTGAATSVVVASSPASGGSATSTDQTSSSGTTVVASSNESNESNESTEDIVGDVAESIDSGIADAATVDAAAERLVPECPQTYTAAPGDSWYGIADAAGVTPSALMAENRATAETVIFAGDDICLPSGATVPTTPPTTAPANTTPTDTTSPATTAPTTTPTTTVATTTPSGSPGPDASVAEVKDVIRSIFPESEWDTAFTIADRESRFVPTAYNGWCCYGVFQIYWNVHRSWLDDLGITSSSDLYDPLLNVKAAYAIWQRAGNSWSPWSTYDG